MRVDVGDRINKGQVQAVLDKRTYNLNVKAAEAEVGRAKVKLAVILAFGLAAGTVLTLAVAPVLYTLFFRVKVP